MGLQVTIDVHPGRVAIDQVMSWLASACEGSHVQVVRHSLIPRGARVTLGVGHYYPDLFLDELGKVVTEVSGWIRDAGTDAVPAAARPEVMREEVIASAIVTMEFLPNLPRDVEENKLTDALNHHLSGRVAHRGWTVAPQSRGGRSADGAMGGTRGGVGSRDLVFYEAGIPIAIFEALVARSYEDSIAKHHKKLTAANGYNPAGVRVTMLAVYFRGADFESFWGRLRAGVAALEDIPEAELVQDQRSTPAVKWATASHADGRDFTLLALNVGAVEAS